MNSTTSRAASRRPVVTALCATVMLPLLVASAFGGQVNHYYFPLQEGNVWIYQQAVDPSSLSKIANASATEAVPQVLGATEIQDAHGMPVYMIDNFFFATGRSVSDAAFGNDDLNHTWLVQGDLMDVQYPWNDLRSPFELPPLAGACIAGTRGQFRLSGSMQVPAGTFDNTITIDYSNQPCGDAGLVSETFAPEVGLIRRTVLSFAGEVTWSLTLAQVDGTIHGSGGPSRLDQGAGAPDVARTPLSASTWGRVKAQFHP